MLREGTADIEQSSDARMEVVRLFKHAALARWLATAKLTLLCVSSKAPHAGLSPAGMAVDPALTLREKD